MEVPTVNVSNTDSMNTKISVDVVGVSVMSQSLIVQLSYSLMMLEVQEGFQVPYVYKRVYQHVAATTEDGVTVYLQYGYDLHQMELFEVQYK
jgi:hypothetical protein